VRVLVIAPGRGSYGPTEVGALARLAQESERGEAAVAEVAAAVDRARARHGLPSIREIDERRPFSSEIHGDAQNASALIFAGSLVDARLFPETLELAGVAGNSLGFYSALAISGVLSLEDAARLVVDVAALQAKHGRGGQLLFPVVDESWRPDPARAETVRAAQRSLEGRAFPSIHLGGFEVLAFAEGARSDLEAALGPARLSGRDYPFALEGHHGYHTPLVQEVASRAREQLADLRFLRPRVHLVDGRGALHTPWSADPEALRAYTLGHQLTEPFDLSAALRVGLRELGPDAVVLLGPGESIGGAIGQAIVADRFFGVSDKERFQERQRGSPVLYALGRAEQRARVLAGSR
jgi:acyl transferase domain-containing protein